MIIHGVDRPTPFSERRIPMSCLLPSRLASKPNDLSVNRRRLIGGLAAGCFGLMAGPAVIGGAIAQARRWPVDPFSLGVASRAPRPDGFVVWTRLAPPPLSGHSPAPRGPTGGGQSV